MTTNGYHLTPPILRVRDFRCVCNRLLFRGALLTHSRVEIRCPKCSRMAIYEGAPVTEAAIEQAVQAAMNGRTS